MNETTNLKLEKPLVTEKYNISVFNNNYDKIDAEIKKLQDKTKPATTNNAGIVQLTDSIQSDSTTTAATPHSVKQVYEETKNKVDKVSGKALSTNDLTNDLKATYDAAFQHSIAPHANIDSTKTEASSANGCIKINNGDVVVYTHPGTHPASMITTDETHRFVTDAEKNRVQESTTTLTANLNSEIARAKNAESTIQTAIDTAYANSNKYTDTKIGELVNGAPETLDTLKEVADAIEENETIVDALNAAIGTKANQAELNTHTGNNTIHITSAEKNKLNGIAAGANNYTLPVSSSTVLGGVKTGANITNSSGTISITKQNVVAALGYTPGTSSATPVSVDNALSDTSTNPVQNKVIHTALTAINTELAAAKKSVADGKSSVASALTTQGVNTAATATFATLATNLNTACTNKYNAGVAATKIGTAVAANVLKGKTFTNASGVNLSGTMNDYSGNIQTVTPTASQTGTATININDGFHTQIKVNSANVYNAGITYADGRANSNSANYKSGYNAGVAAADARVNTGSASYTSGYNAGMAAGADAPLTIYAQSQFGDNGEYWFSIYALRHTLTIWHGVVIGKVGENKKTVTGDVHIRKPADGDSSNYEQHP